MAEVSLTVQKTNWDRCCLCQQDNTKKLIQSSESLIELVMVILQWKTWEVCDEVSNNFAKLSECPSAVDDSYLQALERFVVVMYDRSSDVTTVNEARLDLFARKQRPYDLIPPTQAALKEHAKPAAYEAGYVWGQALERHPQLPIALPTGDG